MSDADYLRLLAAKREKQGRREDAVFLFLMALYFERCIDRGKHAR